MESRVREIPTAGCSWQVLWSTMMGGKNALENCHRSFIVCLVLMKIENRCWPNVIYMWRNVIEYDL